MTIPQRYNRNRVDVLYRVVGNREPIGATLQDADGAAIDLSSRSVYFRMVDMSDGTVVVDSDAATKDDAANGQVSFTPAAGDVDTAGEYAIYFVDDASPPRRWPYEPAAWRLVIAAEQTEV